MHPSPTIATIRPIRRRAYRWMAIARPRSRCCSRPAAAPTTAGRRRRERRRRPTRTPPPTCPSARSTPSTPRPQPVEVVLWHAHAAKTAETLEARGRGLQRVAGQGGRAGREPGHRSTRSCGTSTSRAPARATCPAIALLEDINTQSVIDSGTILPAQSCIDAADNDTSDYLPERRRLLHRSTTCSTRPALNVSIAAPLLQPQPLPAGRPRPRRPARDARRGARGRPGDQGRRRRRDAARPQHASRGSSRSGSPATAPRRRQRQRPWRRRDRSPRSWTTRRRSSSTSGSTDMHDDGLLLAFPNSPGQIDHYLAMAEQNGSMMVATSTAATVGRGVPRRRHRDRRGHRRGRGGRSRRRRPQRPRHRRRAFPGISEPGQVQIGGGVWYITNTTPPEVQAAAWDFVTWWNQPENQVPWHIDGSYLPFSVAASEDPELLATWEGDGAGSWLGISYDQLESSVGHRVARSARSAPTTSSARSTRRRSVR